MNHFLFNLFLLISLINGLVALKPIHNGTKINNKIDVNSLGFAKTRETPHKKAIYKSMYVSAQYILDDDIIPLFRRCHWHHCGTYGYGKAFGLIPDCIIEKREKLYPAIKEYLTEIENLSLRRKENYAKVIPNEDKQIKILESICIDYLKECGSVSCPFMGRTKFLIDDACVEKKIRYIEVKFKEFVDDYEGRSKQ